MGITNYTNAFRRKDQHFGKYYELFLVKLIRPSTEIKTVQMLLGSFKIYFTYTAVSHHRSSLYLTNIDCLLTTLKCIIVLYNLKFYII